MPFDTHAGAFTLVDDWACAGASGWRWEQLYCGATCCFWRLMAPLTPLKKWPEACSKTSPLRSNRARGQAIRTPPH